jgi:hypothetical protein
MCYEFVQTRTRGTYILILLRSGNLIGGALQRVAGGALPSRQPTTTGWMDQSSLFPLYESRDICRTTMVGMSAGAPDTSKPRSEKVLLFVD